MSAPALLSNATKRIAIGQGERVASGDCDVLLTAVLGSCVAICLHDPVARLGGMNHYLLPEGSGADAASARYGAYLCELLINDILALGGVKKRLQAKIFGGARMFDRFNDIGAGNAAFARDFLDRERITIIGESLGGSQARRVDFLPESGRAFQKRVAFDSVAPIASRQPIALPAGAGDPELF